MVLMKIFNTILSEVLVTASQKPVSRRRILSPYKSIHNNRDIFYEEMVLLFFMSTTAKPHVKGLTASALIPVGQILVHSNKNTKKILLMTQRSSSSTNAAHFEFNQESVSPKFIF